MMGICAPFYKRITGEQVRCREARGQAAKVTVVSGPINNLILRWAECPLLGVKRTLVGGAAMSAFYPKRTSAGILPVNATQRPANVGPVIVVIVGGMNPTGAR